MRAWANILMLFTPYLVFGQLTNNSTIVISDNGSVTTNSSVINNDQLSFQDNSQLFLTGSGDLSTANPVILTNLTLQGSDYTVSGNITIDGSLSLLSGTLSPRSDAQLIIGSTATVTRQDGYINGTLYHTGTGDKFYPVGISGTYAPVSLLGVQGSSSTLTGITAVNQDINVTISALPVSIHQVSSNWYWAIAGDDTFNGAQVVLPVLPEDESLFTGNVEGVVLEVGEDRAAVKSLGRGTGSDGTQVVSQDLTVGPTVTIGTRNIVQVTIRNLITPNGDNENDYLYIENLELIEGTKKVYFLDRWGSRTGDSIMDFVNDDPGLPAIFERFESGNYICILQLEDGRTIQQAVTVLKE